MPANPCLCFVTAWPLPHPEKNHKSETNWFRTAQIGLYVVCLERARCRSVRKLTWSLTPSLCRDNTFTAWHLCVTALHDHRRKEWGCKRDSDLCSSACTLRLECLCLNLTIQDRCSLDVGNSFNLKMCILCDWFWIQLTVFNITVLQYIDHSLNKAHDAQIQVHLPKNIYTHIFIICTGSCHYQHDSLGHIGRCCCDCTLATPRGTGTVTERMLPTLTLTTGVKH